MLTSLWLLRIVYGQMLGFHLRQSKLCCIYLSLASKPTPDGKPSVNVSHSELPNLIRCTVVCCGWFWLALNVSEKSDYPRRGSKSIKSWRIDPASPALCTCVSVAHWHSAVPSSELDRADRRGVKPRRRHEILSSFVRLHSVSLCFSLLLCFLNTLCWVWRNGLRKTGEKLSVGWCL